jgi:hypothetical protein
MSYNWHNTYLYMINAPKVTVFVCWQGSLITGVKARGEKCLYTMLKKEVFIHNTVHERYQQQ